MTRLMLFAAAASFVLAAAWPAIAEDGSPDTITQPMRDAVEEHFRKNLVLPQLAIWKYDFTRPYPTGGLSVCGRVNYAVSTRQYYGFLPFYAIFRDGELAEAGIALPKIAQPIQSKTYAWQIACGNS